MLDDIPHVTIHQILSTPDDVEDCLTRQFSELRALRNDAGWRADPPFPCKTKGAAPFYLQEERAWVATAAVKSSKAHSR
jgi:hypothetical protein